MIDKLGLFSAFLLLCSGSLLVSCSHHVTNQGSAPVSGSRIPSPPCIVYRMKADYSKNVPVILTPDKRGIQSYPDIKDIYFNGKLSLPVPLVNGYYLDNRGIGPDVAFLDYTYEEFSKLSSTPPATLLMKHILSVDPVAEMYQCGFRSDYTDIEQQLISIITSGKLTTCKKLK
jgi:hypothetical protein